MPSPRLNNFTRRITRNSRKNVGRTVAFPLDSCGYKMKNKKQKKNLASQNLSNLYKKKKQTNKH